MCVSAHLRICVKVAIHGVFKDVVAMSLFLAESKAHEIRGNMPLVQVSVDQGVSSRVVDSITYNIVQYISSRRNGGPFVSPISRVSDISDTSTCSC